jgi:hypothetical protein
MPFTATLFITLALSSLGTEGVGRIALPFHPVNCIISSMTLLAIIRIGTSVILPTACAPCAELTNTDQV